MLIKNIKLKFFIMFFVVMSSVFLKPTPVSAGVWGEAMAAQLLEIAYNEIKEIIDGAMLSIEKIVAGNVIMNKLEEVFYGSSSSLMIDDYQDFVIGNAQESAKVYAHNIFSPISNSSSSSVRKMGDSVQKAVFASSFGKETKPTIKVDNISRDIFNESQGGGADAFLSTLDNEKNNPFGMFIEASFQVAEHKRATELANTTEAIAGSGFKTSGKPGSVWASMAADSANYNRNLLINATGKYEALGIVAGGLITDAIEKGLSKNIKSAEDKLIENKKEIERKNEEVQISIYEGTD